MAGPSEPTELSTASRRIAASLAEGLHLRVELLAFEAGEERRRLLRFVLSTLGLAFAGFMAFLCLNAALLIYFWDTYRIELVIGLGAFYSLVAAGMAIWLSATTRRSGPPFSGVLETLNEDRRAFRDQT